jgi:uncharacterized protein YfiM (DUF2279 family)
MIKTLALLAVLGAPPSHGWLGADKVKHFFLSAFIHSAAYSAARTARLDRPTAQAIGGVTAASFGFWKEVHDRRSGKPFSAGDLAWDAAGALSAAALLNGTR